MKKVSVTLFAVLFMALLFNDSAVSQKKRKEALKKDALQTFTANILSEVKLLGRDSLLARVEFQMYEVKLGKSGTLDPAHAAFVNATDTVRQCLFYAGATNTVPVKGSGKNRNAWQQFALAGIRPEAYAQFARNNGKLAKVLDPITGSDFKGVLAARVTFRAPGKPDLAPGVNPEDFATLQGKVSEIDGRVGTLESKPPERTKNFWEYFGVGGGYIARAGGSHPSGGNLFVYLSGPPSLEIGWMGWGAYTGGHTGYLMAGFPVSGGAYHGVEITATLLVSDIIREGKDLYLPPYRNTLLPGIGPGLKLKFKVGPIPVFISASALYQPQMYQWEHKTTFPVHAASAFLKLSVPLGGFYED